MSESIKDFLADNDKHAAKVATDIDAIFEDHRAGRIDESMRNELLKDAIELAKVESEASLLDTKIKIEKIIEIAKLAAKLL